MSSWHHLEGGGRGGMTNTACFSDDFFHPAQIGEVREGKYCMRIVFLRKNDTCNSLPSISVHCPRYALGLHRFVSTCGTDGSSSLMKHILVVLSPDNR